MNDTRETLKGRIDLALESLEEHITGYVDDVGAFLDEPDYDGALHEIADGAVPVYTTDLFAIAADDLEVGTREPDSGPAFDGTPTPANIIAANVYELVMEALYEDIQRRKDERDR